MILAIHNIWPLFVGIMFSSEIFKNGIRAGGSLPLSIIYIRLFLNQKNCQIMTKIIMAKRRQQKMNVGTNESYLKLKFSQEIINNGENVEWLKQMRVLKLKFSQEVINNGEKCGWLKQMRAADEKHVSNKWWPILYIASFMVL